MNDKITDGYPAFPQDLQGRRGDDPTLQGMSLRDWFAGQALPGLLLAPDQVGREAQNSPDKTAQWAYQQADAMLRAR